jgi:hypothetical protein
MHYSNLNPNPNLNLDPKQKNQKLKEERGMKGLDLTWIMREISI